MLFDEMSFDEMSFDEMSFDEMLFDEMSCLHSRAVEMITRHFGSVAAMAIKNMDIEKLPVLALVYRLRGTTEIFQVTKSLFFLENNQKSLIIEKAISHVNLLKLTSTSVYIVAITAFLSV
jgi:hypothetical protein